MMIHQDEQIILIVDDDQLLCNAVGTYLSKVGFKPVLANNGREALQILEHTSAQCIIADLYMPSMDGLEFLEILKKRNNTVPVILATGRPDIESAIKAIQSGAFDYLIKPYQFEILKQKIVQALNATRLVRENYVLNELASLHDITGKLTTTHDIEELLDITFDFCLSTAKAESGSIQLYEKENDELVIVRKKGIQTGNPRSSLSKNDEWIISKYVFKSAVPILISENSDLPPDMHLDRGDIGSAISVPLKVGQEVIGVVNLNRKLNREPFTAVDLNIVDVLASQASVAINNAFLYSSINQKLSELSLVSSYSEQLMGLVDKNDVIKCLFETVKKYFAIDFIGFLVMQKRNYEFLYWSRGEIEEESVQDILKRVIDDYNKNPSAKAQYKKTTQRMLSLKDNRSFEMCYPFAFEHLIPVSWEDFKFGTMFFAASNELENCCEKIPLLSSLVSQTRIALTNSKLYNDVKENYIRTIKALAIAVDAKDTYTHGHSENVMIIAGDIAAEMGLDEKTTGIIRDAGLLHDIGKIGIPGYILNKPGPLTYEEFNGVMKTHSSLGANIVKDVPFLSDLYSLILYHHEHYNGAGYPEGLKGEEIPLGARILHIADAYEAMTSNRPYRDSLGEKEAVKRLMEGCGKQFDPEVVKAFLVVAEKKGWVKKEDIEKNEKILQS
ncbi:metal dependent phosphohydrolase [Chitinispirillum alkaliphilum]|nr:metal dependent phosphohydrolase [Chitinispirillum alkaliphilum]